MFAIAPALANEGVLDYTDSGAKKLYNKATAPLSEESYDMSATNLTTFLGDVDTRAVEYGWEPILSIPVDVDADPQVLRLLTTEYGKISFAQVQAHVGTYIDEEGRDAQNSFMLFNCLWSSLSVSAKRKLNLQRDKFQCNGTGIGALLLKVIIQTAYIDTRATTMQLRTNLSSLDTYMTAIKSDITVFNDYVRENLDGLAARGEQSLDVIAYLFKGYEAVTDSKFADFIKRKRDSYEEDDTELTPEELMTATNNKFLNLQRSGLWMKATADQEKIIALEAKVEQLKKGKQQQSQTKGKEKGKGGDKKGKKDEKRPAWIEVPPKSGESETKQQGGKTYYWCANHKRWSINPRHTTATCKGINANKPKSDAKSDGEKKVSFAEDSATKPTLRLANALAMVIKKD